MKTRLLVAVVAVVLAVTATAQAYRLPSAQEQTELTEAARGAVSPSERATVHLTEVRIYQTEEWASQTEEWASALIKDPPVVLLAIFRREPNGEWEDVVETTGCLELPENAPLGLRTCVPREPPSTRDVALGGRVYGAPNGEGWGTERPHLIYNGGDASGSISDVRWISWGGPIAIGWGKHPEFKPHGGYYRRPFPAKLKAERIGRCEGRRAYLRLLIREPRSPGGPLGPWRAWSGSSSICQPYP